MKSNRKSSNPKKSKLIAALIVVLVLAAGTAAYFFFIRDDNSDKAKKTSDSRNVSEDKTHEGQSEGKTFPVPDNVPKDSIKDYILITENEEFKIRKDKESGSYLITLYAIINRPDQYDMYKEQLAEYKQHALQYLKDQGVDVTKVKIAYEPNEATNL